jgi:hypothetical protein
MVRRIVLGLAVLTAAVVVAVAVAGGSSEQRCGQAVDRGVLPEWARTGFSDKEPKIAHVIGREGELAAILFGDPLTAPPDSEHSNKILWVARRTPPPGPLELTAVQGDRTERRTIESGPGPSGVDLPAGCWRISARWPGGEDEVGLRYREG